MSWEGHYQQLCTRGHYWTSQASFAEPEETCPICGSALNWFHTVDDTNCCEDRGDGYCQCGAIEMEKFRVAPAGTCPECSNFVPAIYRVPDDTTPHKVEE